MDVNSIPSSSTYAPPARQAAEATQATPPTERQEPKTPERVERTEDTKPVVNAQGQVTGTRINVIA